MTDDRTPRGVILDLEGVLLRPPSRPAIDLHMEGVRAAYDRLAGSGADLPPFPHAFRLVFRHLEAARVGLAFGNFREIDLAGRVLALLAQVAPDLDSAEHEAALDLWFEPFRRSWALRPGAEGLLRTLADAGWTAHGALNTPWPRPRAEPALRRILPEELLPGLTLSSDVGHRRPNLHFYAAALRALGLPGDRAAYVCAGGPGEVEAAEEMGMRAVTVEQARWLPYEPAARVGTLEEVPAGLEASGRGAR